MSKAVNNKYPLLQSVILLLLGLVFFGGIAIAAVETSGLFQVLEGGSASASETMNTPADGQ